MQFDKSNAKVLLTASYQKSFAAAVCSALPIVTAEKWEYIPALNCSFWGRKKEEKRQFMPL